MIIDASDTYGKIFINKIKERLNHNQNCLIAFIGQTGSGKSYSSMSLSLVLNSHFNINYIYFDIESFITDLSEKKFKAYDCIIIDDAGLSISNRNWQSPFNKAIGLITQSFRFMQLVVIFNMPKLSFIELQVRSLIHFYLIHSGTQGNFEILESQEIKDLNSDADIQAEPLTIDSNTELKEIYFIMPYDDALIREYEKRKSEYMTELYKKLALELKIGKNNVVIKCEYCSKENIVKSTDKKFTCVSCGFINTVKK